MGVKGTVELGEGEAAIPRNRIKSINAEDAETARW